MPCVFISCQFIYVHVFKGDERIVNHGRETRYQCRLPYSHFAFYEENKTELI